MQIYAIFPTYANNNIHITPMYVTLYAFSNLTNITFIFMKYLNLFNTLLISKTLTP